MWAEVTAADEVTIHHRNETGSDVKLAGGVLSVAVRRARTVIGRTGADRLSIRVSGGKGPCYGHIFVKTRAR